MRNPHTIREGLARGCTEFYFYGATGGHRLDHTLANLQSLAFLRRHGARERRRGLWFGLERGLHTLHDRCGRCDRSRQLRRCGCGRCEHRRRGHARRGKGRIRTGVDKVPPEETGEGSPFRIGSAKRRTSGRGDGFRFFRKSGERPMGVCKDNGRRPGIQIGGTSCGFSAA